jgi:hypothetical protein
MIDWPTEDGRSYTRAAPATLSGAVHVVIHGPNIFDIAAMQKVSITKPVAQTTAWADEPGGARRRSAESISRSPGCVTYLASATTTDVSVTLNLLFTGEMVALITTDTK